MTKANGYLRILSFDAFSLDLAQTEALKSICKFIIDVYTPMFISIYSHPSAVEGPMLTILNRDLLLASKEEVTEPAWPSFLRHGSLWVSPKTVALASLSDDPPILKDNVRKISTLPITSVMTKEMLIGRKKLSSFYDITTQCSPCLNIADADVWRSFKNNQMPNKRAIGFMKQCMDKGKVRDSSDTQTDDEIAVIDKRLQGYVVSMMCPY